MGAAQLRQLVSRRVVFLDGGMGTMLMKLGMPPGENPERWASRNPCKLKLVHRSYVDAGSDVVLSCTFGGNARRLGEPPERLNTVLAECLLDAVGSRAIPAASMGPTGELMYPMGELRWKDAYAAYRHQADALARAGLDVFFLETFSDPRELKAAVLAVRDACPHGFISAQMSFDDHGCSLAGTRAEALAVLMEQLPVDAVGANCSVGPGSLAAITSKIRANTVKPVSIEPNAGLPDEAGIHTMGPEAFAAGCDDIVWNGASIIGGCCGTGPDHIRALRDLVGRREPGAAPKRPFRALTSIDRIVPLGREPVLVGESINPTGRPALKRAIGSGDAGFVVSAAGSQRDAGVLDVNLGLERMLPEGFVSEVFARLAVGPPVSVDLSEPRNIELAFRESGGVNLLNSLTCREDFIAERVETLRRHGGFAALLPMGPDGLGRTPAERVALVRRGMAMLAEHGIPRWRVVADPVVMSAASGADPSVTERTLRRMNRLGWLTIAGVSNVSHGLPARRAMNLAFLARLAGEGLDLAIADAARPESLLAARGGRLLSGRTVPSMETEPAHEPGSPSDPLQEAILGGDTRAALMHAREMLAKGSPPSVLVEASLQRAMTRLGELFRRKMVFLPHLIAGAEAARALTDLLRPLMANVRAMNRGTVILATVQGDMHDIGKNLVGLFLEWAGFRVVDLGMDVPSRTIVEAAVSESAVAIGLSALMSTTASRMDEVIRLLRQRGLDIPVLVGGAVVTGEYAESIGAVYSREAFGAAEALERVLGRPPRPGTCGQGS